MRGLSLSKKATCKQHCVLKQNSGVNENGQTTILPLLCYFMRQRRPATGTRTSSRRWSMRMMNDIFTKNRQRIALRQATHFSSILSTVNKFLVSNIRSRSSAQSTRRTAKHVANYREVIVRVRSSATLFPQRLKKKAKRIFHLLYTTLFKKVCVCIHPRRFTDGQGLFAVPR